MQVQNTFVLESDRGKSGIWTRDFERSRTTSAADQGYIEDSTVKAEKLCRYPTPRIDLSGRRLCLFESVTYERNASFQGQGKTVTSLHRTFQDSVKKGRSCISVGIATPAVRCT